MSRQRMSFMLVLVLLAALSLACGFGGSIEAEEATEEAGASASEQVGIQLEAAAPTIQEVMANVKQATIQIVTDGGYTDWSGESIPGDGSGSGFIIDETGIAVTNNHVVIGARSLKVYVGGEREPYSARVLGVSECSDLAVIDLEGDGYSTLEWYDGPIYAGLDVYAAGYLLSNLEFTLTRGIVSKEKADGQTTWASVEGVIEHDATINPGNSGGPLVTPTGQVVAVNYANRNLEERGGSIQYFAISGAKMREIIEQLRQEQDVLALGVNGQALVSDDGDFTGIWVKSVESGSPAAKAGIKGGDLMTQLEGQALATDGTMREYCDTLNSHKLDDALQVQVIRLATKEVLEGEINGDKLEVVRRFDDASRQDSRPSPVNDAGNINRFLESLAAPGVAMTVVAGSYDPANYLDRLDQSALTGDCASPAQRFSYDSHPAYTGYYDFYTNCGSTNSTGFFMTLRPTAARSDFLIFIIARDLNKVDTAHLLDSFKLVGELP